MGDNLEPRLWGCVIGFILAGVVGTVLRNILWYLGRVTAIWRPQTILLPTAQTPWQVLSNGCQSLFILIILIFFLVCLVGISLFMITFFLG